jgi:hypothetical protein
MGNMMIIELVLRKMLQEPPIFDGENPFFPADSPLFIIPMIWKIVSWVML